MEHLALMMALSSVPPDNLELDFFGQSAIVAEQTEASQRSTSGKTNSYIATDKGSRVGLRVKSDSELLDTYGVIEVGIRFPEDEFSNRSSIYIRESSVGVEANGLSASMGYGNSALKLAQLGVDRFNDIYDMKVLITGESVHRYLRVASKLGAKQSASVSVFHSEELEQTTTDGYAFSYIYNGSWISSSFALESRTDQVKRTRVSFMLPRVQCAPSALFQRDHVDAIAESSHAILLSTNCRSGQFGFRTQYIWSKLSDSNVSPPLKIDPSMLGALGFDFYLSQNNRLFTYAGALSRHSIKQDSSRSRATSSTYGAGIELKF